MTNRIEYENIPVWLRITNRTLIDPTYVTKLKNQPGGKGMFATEEVMKIRASKLTTRELAEQYGCTQKTIWNIRRKNSYKTIAL